MSELNIENMIKVAEILLNQGLPIGVKLHPDDFRKLVKECTETPVNRIYDLPVYVDVTVPQGTYKLIYRKDDLSNVWTNLIVPVNL